jgi:hypothetical protein
MTDGAERCPALLGVSGGGGKINGAKMERAWVMAVSGSRSAVR